MKACGSILTTVFMILLFVNVFLFFVYRRPGEQQQSTYEHRRRPEQQQQQQQCEHRRRSEQQQQQLRRPVPSQSIGRSTAGYAIVGYLESVTLAGMVPLYARPSPTHRHRFNYYTRNSNEYLIRLPIVKDGRDCTNNLGCDELYDKDVVHVPGIPDSLTVHMYSKEF